MSYIYWEKYVHPLYLSEFLHELNLIDKLFSIEND